MSKKIIEVFESIGLCADEIQKIAIETGFQKRTPKKLNPVEFLSLIYEEALRGDPSYNELAYGVEKYSKTIISRQAIAKRITENCTLFFEKVFERIFTIKVEKIYDEVSINRERYNRVLIQDSTVIRLPSRLFDIYSGGRNQHKTVCNARIQCIYDLVASKFIDFSITPYSENDHCAASMLDLKDDDLVLRDRGYLSLIEIRRQIDAGADFIYRHKSTNKYFDPVTKKEINLLKLLMKKRFVDCEVILNDGQNTKIRLVAEPVSEEVAQARKRELNKDGNNHNRKKDFLKLAEWTIFITNIPQERASFNELLEIYSIRWRIECIFKTWKSYFNFNKVHNVSKYQLRVYIAAKLAMIVLCNDKIYIPAYKLVKRLKRKDVSLMKLMKYLSKNTAIIPEIISQLLKAKRRSKIIDVLARYCTYDSRKRKNFAQIQERIFNDWLALS